jgi:putative glutamine amidotransferase
MRPLIGMTASIMTLEWAGNLKMPAAVGWSSYTRAIAAAGGVPVVLAPDGDGIEEVLAAVHGLVLPGGADLDPALYGETSVHPTVYGINHDRDHFEIELVRAAVARDLPVLAICRGIQVLNVALGGTLYQDVPDLHPAHVDHNQQVMPSEAHHEIALEPGSCLALAYGSHRVSTNSFHHQGVRDVAPGLRAVGWSPDGLVEGLESPAHRFVVGVQWHPEVMFEAHQEHLRPFTALVSQAAAYRERIMAGVSAECWVPADGQSWPGGDRLAGRQQP